MKGFSAQSKTPPIAEAAAGQGCAPFVGTLTDSDIREYVGRKLLISENFEEKCIKQSCYELRASEVYYHPVESDTKKVVSSEEQAILLRPNQVVVIITKESLNVPNDILGRVLTKGTLFSLGVSAVNTYVDPGFKGKLGIVFQNQATKYLKIPVGEPIAKIEFSKLHTPVKEAYHGQHGYESKIWPVNRDFFVEQQELKDKFNISDPMEELGLLYGDAMQKAYHAALRLQRRLTVAVLIFLAVAAILLGVALYFGGAESTPLSWIISLVTGVVSSITATILIDLRDKRAKK